MKKIKRYFVYLEYLIVFILLPIVVFFVEIRRAYSNMCFFSMYKKELKKLVAYFITFKDSKNESK